MAIFSALVVKHLPKILEQFNTYVFVEKQSILSTQWDKLRIHVDKSVLWELVYTIPTTLTVRSNSQMKLSCVANSVIRDLVLLQFQGKYAVDLKTRFGPSLKTYIHLI